MVIVQLSPDRAYQDFLQVAKNQLMQSRLRLDQRPQQYDFASLGIAQPLREQALKRNLIARLKDFMIELGYGFCFIGSQYRLTLGDANN